MVSPLCKTFDYDTNTCQDCFSGFTLTEGNCLLAEGKAVIDPNCKAFDNDGECFECSQGSYFNPDGICEVVSAFCKTFDFDNIVCSECYEGYNLNNGTCIRTDSSLEDSTCAEWLNGVCAQCVPRAYFDFDNNCVMVSDLCDTFNDFSGECTSCYSGYSLSDGECIVSASSSDCVKSEGDGSCSECPQGSYLSGGKCIPINPFCKEFNF